MDLRNRIKDAATVQDENGNFPVVAVGFVANVDGSYKILSRKQKNEELDEWILVPLTSSPLWVEGIGIKNADDSPVVTDAVTVIFRKIDILGK